jgi:hypothetical protein
LLKNAEKNIHADVEHRISARDLMKGIGWSTTSKTPENLKECLSELVSIKIQWNIFEIDRKSKWITSTLLASVALKGGDVYYSYSHHLRALLSQPNIYAKLDLGIQKLFKVKYSMLIWEYISGELSSKKTDSVTTQWLTYENILKLTYLKNALYENRYSLFLERVIDKSIDEINVKADLQITYETLSERGKLTHIRFQAHRKNGGRVIDLGVTKTTEGVEILKHFQLSSRQISEIKSKYTSEEISRAYEFFISAFDSSVSKIKNPVAFFKKALEEGWVTADVMAQRIETSVSEKKSSANDSVLKAIHASEDADQIKAMRIDLFNSLGGGAPYKTWMQNVRILRDKDILTIVSPTSFARDWIENKYRQDIVAAAKKCFEHSNISVEFSTIEDLKLEGRCCKKIQDKMECVNVKV